MFDEGPRVGDVGEGVPEKCGKLANAEKNSKHSLSPVESRDQREDDAEEENQ